MAERVACTGFWAAFRTATSGFEAGLVAAFAAGRLERLIVDFFMGEIMGERIPGSKRGEARPRAGCAPGALVPRFPPAAPAGPSRDVPRATAGRVEVPVPRGFPAQTWTPRGRNERASSSDEPLSGM